MIGLRRQPLSTIEHERHVHRVKKAAVNKDASPLNAFLDEADLLVKALAMATSRLKSSTATNRPAPKNSPQYPLAVPDPARLSIAPL